MKDEKKVSSRQKAKEVIYKKLLELKDCFKENDPDLNSEIEKIINQIIKYKLKGL